MPKPSTTDRGGPRKQLLLDVAADATTFRIADTRPPLEEVSETGGGTYRGMSIRFLYTVKVRPGARVDRVAGSGLLYASGGRAPYKISGTAAGGPDFSERVRGTWTFGSGCTGALRELRNTKASFVTSVDAAGRSTTKVWRA
jgi:hypothetical protein